MIEITEGQSLGGPCGGRCPRCCILQEPEVCDDVGRTDLENSVPSDCREGFQFIP